MTRHTLFVSLAGAIALVAAAATWAVVAITSEPRVEHIVVTRPPPEPDTVLVLGLLDEGLAVEDGNAVVFLTVHGDVIRRLEGFRLGPDSRADGEILLAKGDDLYAGGTSGGSFRQLSREEADARKAPAPSAGCRLADRHDTTSFLVCTDDTAASAIVRLDADGTTTTVASSPDRSWESVMVSPDGHRFLTTTSGDCAPPRVLVGSTTENAVTPLGALIGTAEEPDAVALGWTASGHVLFAAAGNCGPPLQEPGVYTFDGEKTRAIYTAATSPGDWATATKWTAPARPQPAAANSSSRRS